MLFRWLAGRFIPSRLTPHETQDAAARGDADTVWWPVDYAPQKVIVGTSGNDMLVGGSADDSIDGGPGQDRMAGRGGSDTYYVDNAGDSVREQAQPGVDTVFSSVSWTLGSNVENLTLMSTTLASLVGTGNALDNTIVDSYGSNQLNGRGGNDTLLGGHISAPGKADTLNGGDGDDHLEAGLLDYSSDKLHGGNGNDTLIVGHGSNVLYGEDGDDLLVSGVGGVSQQAADWLDGGAGNDTLIGGRHLDGGTGDDLLRLSVSGEAFGREGHDVFECSAVVATGQGAVEVLDFEHLIDQFAVSQSTLAVGDGDLVVDGATVAAGTSTGTGPGGFDASAELVIVAADVVGDLTPEAAAAAIGSANSAFAGGQTAVFVLDNGVDSAAFYFQSSGNDALVSSNELSLLVTLTGSVNLSVEDVVWRE